jgi:transcriptional regulator with XRE-family HTH domain
MTYNVQNLRQLRKDIGRNIQQVRTSQSLTLRRFSEVTHIKMDLLDAFETGSGQISFDALHLIATFL